MLRWSLRVLQWSKRSNRALRTHLQAPSLALLYFTIQSIACLYTTLVIHYLANFQHCHGVGDSLCRTLTRSSQCSDEPPNHTVDAMPGSSSSSQMEAPILNLHVPARLADAQEAREEQVNDWKAEDSYRRLHTWNNSGLGKLRIANERPRPTSIRKAITPRL